MVNFSQEYHISSRDDRNLSIYDEEHYYDFARDLGFKGYELFSLPYYSHRLMQALPKKKTPMSKQEVVESLSSVLRYLTTKDPSAEPEKNLVQQKIELDSLEN